LPYLRRDARGCVDDAQRAAGARSTLMLHDIAAERDMMLIRRAFRYAAAFCRYDDAAPRRYYFTLSH